VGLCYLYCNCQAIGSSFSKAHVHPFRFAALYYCFEVTVVLMFLSFFPKTKRKLTKKIYGAMLFYSVEDDTQKFGRFWTRESFFTRKGHLRQSCTKPFNCCPSFKCQTTKLVIFVALMNTLIEHSIVLLNWGFFIDHLKISFLFRSDRQTTHQRRWICFSLQWTTSHQGYYSW